MKVNKRHVDKFIELAEGLGWTSHLDLQSKTQKYIELYWRPSNDEDFSLPLFNLNSVEMLAHEVEVAYEGFDIDDHVMMWLEEKQSGTSGVPGVQALVEDAVEIEAKLRELSDAADELARKYE